MIKTIRFAKIYDEAGRFSHLNLIQGDKFISISFGSTTLDNDPEKNNYKWNLLKEIVETMKEEVKND